MKIGIQTWGSEGDIRPFVALAVGLSRAGHAVTLVVTDAAPRDYSRFVEGSGVSLRHVATPVFKNNDEVIHLIDDMKKVRGAMARASLLFKRSFDPALEAMTAAAVELCAGSDLVVGHYMLYFLHAVAEKAGIPYVTVQLTPGFIRTHHASPIGLPDLGRWFYGLEWKLFESGIDRLFLGRANGVRAQLGLKPVRHVVGDVWTSARLNLLAVSPVVAVRQPDWDVRHVICGFLAPDTSGGVLPEGLSAFIDAGATPVFFGFGSVTPVEPEMLLARVRIWIASARRIGLRAIVQAPLVHGMAELTDAPDVFRLDGCPHHLVYPRCVVVVHHGGAGTTQSALRAGVPSVVVAHHADQFFWAALLEKLGVAGPMLAIDKFTVDRLAAALQHVVMNAAYAARARTLAERMLGEDGVACAVSAIDALEASQ